MCNIDTDELEQEKLHENKRNNSLGQMKYEYRTGKRKIHVLNSVFDAVK